MAEYFDVAAKWWRERLENKMSLSNFQNAERDSRAGGDFMMLAALAFANKADEKPEDLDRFEKLLREQIKRRVEELDNYTLSTDYGPDYELSKVAVEAGLKSPVFPVKTCMHISKEKVTVSHGYGNPFKTIYPVTT